MQPGFPPQVDSSQLRPKLRWFAVAAVIAAVGIGAGAGLLAYGIGGIAAPMTKTFGEGETVSVRLDQDSAIYVASGESTYGSTCTVTSADGKPAAVDAPGYTFTKTADGREWQLLRTIRIANPGDYRLACTEGPGPYAVADQPDVGRFVTGLVLLFVLSGLGIVIGAVIAIVVGVKRSNHRRLMDQLRDPGPAHP